MTCRRLFPRVSNTFLHPLLSLVPFSSPLSPLPKPLATVAALLLEIYPLRYRPCPRNSGISYRLFFSFSSLFFLRLFCRSLCFSRAQFCVCLSFIPLPRRSERFEGSIFDRSPSLQRLTVDVSDSRASMLDRPAAIPSSILRPSKSLCCVLALTNIACTLYFLFSYSTMSLSPDWVTSVLKSFIGLSPMFIVELIFNLTLNRVLISFT